MKYKIGDKVKVRKWDDMANEFGVNDYGDIKAMFYFPKENKKFCGKIVTIKDIEINREGVKYYRILEDIENEFCFSDDMFEYKIISPILIGVDILNLVDDLSNRFLSDSPNMTYSERVAYKIGKDQTLGLLKQVFGELYNDEGLETSSYIVQIPGLNVVTYFASIDAIQEQFGEDKV